VAVPASALVPAVDLEWQAHARRVGYCAHPVRLRGQVHHIDTHTGEAREVYSTDREPTGLLLTPCGTRRAAHCPACAETYRADAYQLIKAGLAGGKGIPDTVAGHPAVFATFTAPSFGPVHTRREDRAGRLLPCHPRRHATVCPHGIRAECRLRHRPDDPRLGEPLCWRCYDYDAAVLWNALAPRLWQYTIGTYLYRALARLTGHTEAEVKALVKREYGKVAEFQARGQLHYHTIIRLDHATPDQDGQVQPPPAEFTPGVLEDAIRLAVAMTTVPVPAPLTDPHPHVARWGSQLDIRHLRSGAPGDLSEQAVAGYIAKYATKATETYGPALTRRLTPGDLARLDSAQVRPHIARHVRAAWRLGAHPYLARLRLQRWAHQLGFGGHFLTRSRRYSTTFTSLRRARATYRRTRHGGVPLDAFGRPDGDDATVILATWAYVGSGWRTEANRQLAIDAAARAREHRRLARQGRATAA
jgi:hypothetical protein